MIDFEDTQSVNQEEQAQNTQNRLEKMLEYESCPHCERTFFLGKLQYHLKLCTKDNPMLKSPKKTPNKLIKSSRIQKNSLLSNQMTKCPKCSTRLPAFLFERHLQKCQISNKQAIPRSTAVQNMNKKSSTDVNFKEKDESFLPLIKNSVRDKKQRSIMKQSFHIKIREELSCFRKASQIKQVQCSSCGRIFSKEASLRHIPICEALKEKADKSIALRKKKSKISKSSVFDESLLTSSVERLRKPKSMLSAYAQSKTEVRK